MARGTVSFVNGFPGRVVGVPLPERTQRNEGGDSQYSDSGLIESVALHHHAEKIG